MIKRMDEEAKASFEEMYLTYQDTLRRLAYAYDIPVDDIDDIIQDTFVSYARYDYSLKQPEEGKKILLGRILRSRCMDFHRQKKKRYCEDLNGETFAAEEYRMQLHQPGLVDVFSGKERCKAILDEVDRMPENWQKVREGNYAPRQRPPTAPEVSFDLSEYERETGFFQGLAFGNL